MSVSYLLDTNTASFVIRGNPPEVLGHLARVTCSFAILYCYSPRFELLRLERRAHATQLRIVVTRFLERATILPWGSKAARHYARLRTALGIGGKAALALNTMVAAQALAEESRFLSPTITHLPLSIKAGRLDSSRLRPALNMQIRIFLAMKTIWRFPIHLFLLLLTATSAKSVAQTSRQPPLVIIDTDIGDDIDDAFAVGLALSSPGAERFWALPRPGALILRCGRALAGSAAVRDRAQRYSGCGRD